MLILIEGCDGTGKTTFAKQLISELPGATYLHRGKPSDDILFEYEDQDLERYRPRVHEHIVADRWHLGELIYGPLYRDQTLLTPPKLLHVELYLRSRGALLVHLDAPEQVIYDRIYGDEARDGGEDFLQKTHVQVALTNYRKAVAVNRLSTLRFREPQSPASVSWTIACARRADRRAAKLGSYHTYVGYEKPELLLIGDRRSDEQIAPTFVPTDASSGHFLLTSLLTLDTLPRLGMANSYDEDLRALWRALDHPRVVATGRMAQSRLRAAEVPHGVVPHPQAIRRFHHGKSETYAHLILEVAETREDRGSWPTS